MTDDLIARLRHSDARYLADRCHIHAEAADALEAAENAIHTAQRQRDIWEKVAETQVARIAELEATVLELQKELAEARACLRAAPDPWKAPDQKCWRHWQLDHAPTIAAARGKKETK
jgi:hypothetical protein